MRWDDLQIFLALARAGQHGRAARTLGVDATTVARRLRRLEAETGRRLVEQGRDGQTLTEEGQRLLKVAERMEAAAAALPDDGGDAGDTLGGLVRVSVSEGFGAAFVAPRLPAFARAHPHLAVDLAASSGFLSPSRRETDVAILLGRPRHGPLVTRKLADYALGLYAAPAYLAAAGTPSGPAALAGHRLVGYIPDLLYAPELDYLGEVAGGLAPGLRSSSVLAQARLTAAGGGIAVLPRFLAAGDAALVPVLPDVRIVRSFWLVTHRDLREAPRVRRFVDWIAAETAAARPLLMGR